MAELHNRSRRKSSSPSTALPQVSLRPQRLHQIDAGSPGGHVRRYRFRVPTRALAPSARSARVRRGGGLTPSLAVQSREPCTPYAPASPTPSRSMRARRCSEPMNTADVSGAPQSDAHRGPADDGGACDRALGSPAAVSERALRSGLGSAVPRHAGRAVLHSRPLPSCTDRRSRGGIWRRRYGPIWIEARLSGAIHHKVVE